MSKKIMNVHKYISCFFALIMGVFLLGSYGCASQTALLWDGTYNFRIVGISFSGDWSHHKNVSKMDKLRITANTDPKKGDSDVVLNNDLKYDKNNMPYFVGLDDGANYTFNGDKGLGASSTLKIGSRFSSSTKPNETTPIDTTDYCNVKNMGDHNIRLRYNADNTSTNKFENRC